MQARPDSSRTWPSGLRRELGQIAARHNTGNTKIAAARTSETRIFSCEGLVSHRLKYRMKPFCDSRGCTVVSQNPRNNIARSTLAMHERRYATFMPGKASVGPLWMGGTNALYSKRNVAQSSTVSQTPFSTAPPIATVPSGAILKASNMLGASFWVGRNDLP